MAPRHIHKPRPTSWKTQTIGAAFLLRGPFGILDLTPDWRVQSFPRPSVGRMGDGWAMDLSCKNARMVGVDAPYTCVRASATMARGRFAEKGKISWCVKSRSRMIGHRTRSRIRAFSRSAGNVETPTSAFDRAKNEVVWPVQSTPPGVVAKFSSRIYKSDSISTPVSSYPSTCTTNVLCS